MAYPRGIRLYSFGAWLLGCATLLHWHPAQAQNRVHHDASWAGQTGVASYYARKYSGRNTASGRRYDTQALTAAHAWLPFGTKVRVTLKGTHRSVVVVVTDRLPAHRRIIDVSAAAARKLGMLRQGLAVVSLSPG